jgi:hypothetical protein
MAKIFYDHLTVTEEIVTELDKYKITSVEKTEIVELIDENVHHSVLNVILKNLPKEKHEEFLLAFHHRPHDPDLLEYLKKEIKDIEKIITDEANKVKKELLAEIKNAQRN